jgi:DNA recombination protein RmuC
VDGIQREHRIVVAGPTTLAALLSSLQMGFRTLAIQRRSSEVWGVLGQVKTEFARYAGVLEQVKRKLEGATSTVEQAAVRTRAIERRLKGVEAAEAGDEPIISTCLPRTADRHRYRLAKAQKVGPLAG